MEILWKSWYASRAMPRREMAYRYALQLWHTLGARVSHKRIRNSGRVPGEEGRAAIERIRSNRAVSKRIRAIADDSGIVDTLGDI